MGKLIVMPVRTAATETAASAPPADRGHAPTPVVPECSIDFRPWLSAPRERNTAYLPTYAAVSDAMQTALRQWVREWLEQNPDSLDRRTSGYSLLVFSCTRPYRARNTSLFTYDVQQTSAIDQAFRAAARVISEQTAQLAALRQPNAPRLFPREITTFVSLKRQNICRMFHIETLLMDEILKFTQVNIARLGLDRAASELRSAFEKHLHRFSEEFDMAERAADLLRVATGALCSRCAEDFRMPIAA